MKIILPMAKRAISTAIPIHLIFLAALLAGCNREDAKTGKKVEPIASDNTLPPITAPQVEPAPPADTNNTALAHTAPPATPPPVVTNELPPVVVQTNELQASTKEYTVVRGDTLFKIARANKVKISAITRANPNVDLGKIKAGQKIHIPSGPAAGALGFREPDSSDKNGLAGSTNVHVVKIGENLTQIARQHHTTVKALQAANGMKTTRVLVGQKLRLPAAGASATATNLAKPTDGAPNAPTVEQ